jgi:hypothetical protein
MLYWKILLLLLPLWIVIFTNQILVIRVYFFFPEITACSKTPGKGSLNSKGSRGPYWLACKGLHYFLIFRYAKKLPSVVQLTNLLFIVLSSSSCSPLLCHYMCLNNIEINYIVMFALGIVDRLPISAENWFFSLINLMKMTQLSTYLVLSMLMWTKHRVVMPLKSHIQLFSHRILWYGFFYSLDGALLPPIARFYVFCFAKFTWIYFYMEKLLWYRATNLLLLILLHGYIYIHIYIERDIELQIYKSYL